MALSLEECGVVGAGGGGFPTAVSGGGTCAATRSADQAKPLPSGHVPSPASVSPAAVAERRTIPGTPSESPATTRWSRRSRSRAERSFVSLPSRNVPESVSKHMMSLVHFGSISARQRRLRS